MAYTAGARRVLVVEDDPEGLEGLRELLTLWGYDVDVADDSKRALVLVGSRRPGTVVMDLGLPDGDALELIRLIKAETESTVVIAFSGWNHLETSARVAGADWFILKPDLTALEHVLARVKTAQRFPVAVAGKKTTGRDA